MNRWNTDRLVVALLVIVLIGMTVALMYQGSVVADQRQVIRELYKDCR